MELPGELTERATLRGNELAWSIEHFPAVLARGRELGCACLGGEFQFRTPGSTCEMYWLGVDSDERAAEEPWAAYATRSCTQVLDRFNATVANADFVEEAKRWTDVAELSGPAANPLAHLCFVAYFCVEEAASE